MKIPTPPLTASLRFTLLALFITALSACAPTHSPVATATPTPSDGKLRIIVFGAHPDDAELKAGGAAMKWAALGHHVKMVSVTNAIRLRLNILRCRGLCVLRARLVH